MQKIVLFPVCLAVNLQPGSDIREDQCLNGVISKTPDGFRFEEAVKRTSAKRNPKLFDGKYISLVHMANGRYKCHFRTIDASAVTNRHKLAHSIYMELLKALEILD